jgi:hypothetical protein
MSISVKYESDTYTFASYDGSHYWYLSETPRTSFSKIIGIIPPTELEGRLYEIALNTGYSEDDFNKIRTKARTKSLSSNGGEKRSARILSGGKTPVRKSTLSNSIKLF